MLASGGEWLYISRMPTVDDLGLVIHVLRVIQRLSQGELGERAGVRNSSISNYERGKVVPKFETIQKLAEGMGLPLLAVEETQSFIRRVRRWSGVVGGEVGGTGEIPAPNGAGADGAEGGERALAGRPLEEEMDRVVLDAGRVASRMTRLVLELLARDGGEEE